jgi:hypothetical protein
MTTASGGDLASLSACALAELVRQRRVSLMADQAEDAAEHLMSDVAVGCPALARTGKSH